MTPPSTDHSAQSPRKRRRPARSCQECRRKLAELRASLEHIQLTVCVIGRKIKCDLTQPCSHCRVSRISCVYNVGKAPIILGTATNAERPRALLERGPSPPDIARSKQSQSSVAVLSSLPHNQSAQVSLQPLPTPEEDEERELEVLRRRISALEEHIAASTAAGSVTNAAKEISQTTQSSQRGQQYESVTTNSGLQDREGPQNYGRLCGITQEVPLHDRQLILNKSRLYGPSHWTHGGNEVRKDLGL